MGPHSDTLLPEMESPALHSASLQLPSMLAMPDFADMMPVDDDFLESYLHELEGVVAPDNGSTVPVDGFSRFLEDAIGTEDNQDMDSNVLPIRNNGLVQPTQAMTMLPSLSDGSMESHVPRNGNHSGPENDRGSKRRLRTIQQQQNNKLAQQRYREKRKTKYSELEDKVEVLTAEIDTLKAVQGEAARLSGENEALRFKLQEQASMIDTLQRDMQGILVSDCPEIKAVSQHKNVQALLQSAGEPLKSRIQKLSPEQATIQFGRLVDCIKAYLQRRGLPDDGLLPGHPEYANPATQAELTKLVGETCIQCMQLFMNREMSAKEKASTTSTERFTMVPDCHAVKAKWSKCLDRISLSEDQEGQLLSSRTKCLDALRDVFSERNRLNLMAIGMLLPHPGQHLNQCFDPSPEAKLKCMEINGSLYCMRSEKQLTDVLDSLKLNLKAEQKVIMELNYIFVHKVLRPEQAAIMLVAAYPSNIDTLAVANLLSYRKGFTQDPNKDTEGQQTPMLDPLVPSTSIAILGSR